MLSVVAQVLLVNLIKGEGANALAYLFKASATKKKVL
jgi:hypothetical protein